MPCRVCGTAWGSGGYSLTGCIGTSEAALRAGLAQIAYVAAPAVAALGALPPPVVPFMGCLLDARPDFRRCTGTTPQADFDSLAPVHYLSPVGTTSTS